MPVQEEIEVKFILLLAQLLGQVKLEPLPRQKIVQSYFSRERIMRELIPELRRLLPDWNVPGGVEFRNGRIRAIEQDGCHHYQITVKGPRERFYSRLEVEAQIDQETYGRLLSLVDEGSVEKTRYFLEGNLFLGNQALPVTADIDQLHSAAGRSLAAKGVPEFVVVEVEVSDRKLIDTLKRGQHNFEFLRSAHEIAALPERMQRALRMRYFAQHGLDRQLRDILTELFPG